MSFTEMDDAQLVFIGPLTPEQTEVEEYGLLVREQLVAEEIKENMGCVLRTVESITQTKASLDDTQKFIRFMRDRRPSQDEDLYWFHVNTFPEFVAHMAGGESELSKQLSRIHLEKRQTKLRELRKAIYQPNQEVALVGCANDSSNHIFHIAMGNRLWRNQFRTLLDEDIGLMILDKEIAYHYWIVTRK